MTLTANQQKRFDREVSDLELKGVSYTEAVSQVTASTEKRLAANKRATANRKERDDLMKSCGLVKVRGSVSGKIYWE